MKKPFIKTMDAQFAKSLKAQGFHLLSESEGIFTFVNDPEKPIQVNFADDISKFTYSDKLCF